MRGNEDRQGDFLSHAVYDSMIPADHYFYRLRSVLDWHRLAVELVRLLSAQRQDQCAAGGDAESIDPSVSV